MPLEKFFQVWVTFFPSSWEQEYCVEKRLCKFEAVGREFVTFSRHYYCLRELGKKSNKHLEKTLSMIQILTIVHLRGRVGGQNWVRFSPRNCWIPPLSINDVFDPYQSHFNTCLLLSMHLQFLNPVFEISAWKWEKQARYVCLIFMVEIFAKLCGSDG